jgi:Tol biopolymer transport system component
MPLPEVLRIAIPIADALARAHGRGIIHRDLKPANVMVGPEGVVKILDFGLAKRVGPTEASLESETKTDDRVPLTRPGTIAGTVGYMSPEQATGGKVDPRSDVFSFGTVLYEMVTGRRAFNGTTTAEVLAAVLKEQPTPPAQLTPQLPRDLEKVILRCLQKDVDRRFQHMQDVNIELQEIKEDMASAPAATTAVPASRSRRLGRLAASLAGLLVLATGGWLLWRSRVSLPPPRVVPLTVTRGVEAQPTFSPDGEQVAFSWGGEKSDNSDVYVKMLGGSEVHRLTTDPAWDGGPSWSRDGRQIAFVRSSPGGGTLHLVSPLGGPDRKLTDFRVRPQISWSADGRWLAAAHVLPEGEGRAEAGGIYLVPAEGGEPRRLTRAQPSGDDVDPSFSPDGRRLAYASCASVVIPPRCDVYVLELGPDFMPSASPRRLTQHNLYIRDTVWTRDGASVVYTVTSAAFLWHLFRVSVRGDRPPERIEIAGLKASTPAVAPSGHRLAFSRLTTDRDIYRFQGGKPSEAFLVSSMYEGHSEFSPDGRRIAFETMRSGDQYEIWLAAADGSNPAQLTRGPGRSQGAPAWSPDGRQIAFDSTGEDGHADIWTIDAADGTPHRLTKHPGNETVPSWSRDGRFVYFTSDRGGARDVWRVPAAGGEEERVTRGGAAHGARESMDGKELFFKRKDGPGPLVAMRLPTGPERTLVKCVGGGWGFALGAAGVYYPGCANGDPPLHLFDPATGRDRVLGTLDDYVPMRITVSPDGKTILYSKSVSEGADLMLIESFR